MFSKSSQTQRNICCITCDLLKLNRIVLEGFHIKQTRNYNDSQKTRSRGDQDGFVVEPRVLSPSIFCLLAGHIVTIQCFINVVHLGFYVLFCMCINSIRKMSFLVFSIYKML